MFSRAASASRHHPAPRKACSLPVLVRGGLPLRLRLPAQQPAGLTRGSFQPLQGPRPCLAYTAPPPDKRWFCLGPPPSACSPGRPAFSCVGTEGKPAGWAMLRAGPTGAACPQDMLEPQGGGYLAGTPSRSTGCQPGTQRYTAARC